MAKGIAKALGLGGEKARKVSDPFAGIKIPSIEEQSIILQSPDLMGEFTPEQVEAMQMNQSAMEQVKADPSLVAKQNEALEGISEVAKGGYSEGDKATAREVQRTVSQDAQARQKAILNSMANRGVLGSGMELAAQLQSNQQAAEQMSRGGEGLTQQAQSRALAALGQQGALAGQIRSQDVGEQSDVAKARDSINQFNVQNQQNVNNQNVGNRNQAQLQNLQQRQERENQRAQIANQQQMHNKGLVQQGFQNKIQQAGGTAQINQIQAQADSAAQAANASQIGSLISGGATMGAAFIKPSDKNLKENITKSNISDFLDKLTAYDYNYKNPEKFGEGPQTGVMAQDLEKSKIGKPLVENTSEGKMVDYGKSAPALLASIVELNKRIKKLEGRE